MDHELIVAGVMVMVRSLPDLVFGGEVVEDAD
jgi:hypothetical protein